MRKTILTAVAALLSMAATAQITETPEGEMLKNMEWQSQGMYPDYVAQQMYQFVEQGAIAHVVVSGNKMYIKDPITKYKVGAWIEGEISDDGTQVVFHTPQAYTESNGTLFYLTPKASRQAISTTTSPSLPSRKRRSHHPPMLRC